MVDRMLTVREMAERAGFSEAYFYCGHSTGKLTLPLAKLGRSLRCRESVFERWLNGEAVPAPAPRGEKRPSAWLAESKPWEKRKGAKSKEAA